MAIAFCLWCDASLPLDRVACSLQHHAFYIPLLSSSSSGVNRMYSCIHHLFCLRVCPRVLLFVHDARRFCRTFLSVCIGTCALPSPPHLPADGTVHLSPPIWSRLHHWKNIPIFAFHISFSTFPFPHFCMSSYSGSGKCLSLHWHVRSVQRHGQILGARQSLTPLSSYINRRKKKNRTTPPPDQYSVTRKRMLCSLTRSVR